MSPDSVKDIVFFHGTSSHFARNIVGKSDGRGFPASQAITLGQALFKQCLSYVGGWLELADFFQKGGSEGAAIYPLALKNIAEGRQKSLIAYGGFYVSFNPVIAASYAINSYAGSESLTVLQDTIAVLRSHRDPEVEKLVSAAPDIYALLAMPHDPVLLEISGLEAGQLETEFGEDSEGAVIRDLDAQLGLWRDFGARVPGAYRIKSISHHNIRAVYPLPKVGDFESGEFISGFRIPVEHWPSS